MPVDPALVADTIAYLTGQSDDRFGQALADNIMEPDEVETEAFRSPELVGRSLIAARSLLDHVNTVMRTREGPEASNKDLRRRTEIFRNKVGRERRILESIVAEAGMRRGIIRNAPNPQARALRRLKQLHLAEFQELKREEEARIAEERREARRQAKQAAREARRSGMSHA